MEAKKKLVVLMKVINRRLQWKTSKSSRLSIVNRIFKNTEHCYFCIDFGAILILCIGHWSMSEPEISEWQVPEPESPEWQQAAVAAGAVAVWKCLNLIGRTPKILFSYSSKMQLPLLWLAGKSELTVGELLIGAGETLRDDTQGTQRLSRDSR